MNDKLLFELLDINQFKKLHHSVIVRNLISSTLIGRDGPIAIIEFMETGIIIKTEPKSVAY